MLLSHNKNSMESYFTYILKGIFKVKSTSSIKSFDREGERNRIKKNELDYFEYTYLSDSPC